MLQNGRITGFHLQVFLLYLRMIAATEIVIYKSKAT